MKLVLSGFVLIYFLLTSIPCYAFKDWSWNDRILFSADLLTAYYATRQVSHYEEADMEEWLPWVEPYKDEPRKVLIMAAGFYAFEWYILDRYPKLRQILPWQFSIHVVAVTRNREKLYHELGIRVPF